MSSAGVAVEERMFCEPDHEPVQDLDPDQDHDQVLVCGSPDGEAADPAWLVARPSCDPSCGIPTGAALACRTQVSRVLWSTGHLASSSFAPPLPSFIVAAAVPSLRLTRTVSRMSLCIVGPSFRGSGVHRAACRRADGKRSVSSFEMVNF